jgi:hypothetical protein
VDLYAEGDRAQETDEEPVEIVPIRQQEEMEAIRLLQSYKEQQDDGDSRILRRLAQMEITVRGRMLFGLQQAKITRWLT